RNLFRRALVQGMMANQTDSKQGQEPLFYFEVIYKPEYDVYLGDLRRFIDVKQNDEDGTGKEGVIRSLNDLIVDFSNLSQVITDLKNKGYIEKVIGWVHPITQKSHLLNMPAFELVDLWGPI